MIAWIKAHIYLRTRRRQQKHLEHGKHIDSKKGTLGGWFYGGSWRGEAEIFKSCELRIQQSESKYGPRIQPKLSEF